MKNYILLFCLLLGGWSLHAQFRTNGTAISQGNDCFRLTRNLTTQSGSVWYLSTVDISKPFDLYFEVNLGCSNGGADGMAFVLQPISSSVGSSGGGLGYQGITPSLAIEMDTYQNGNWGDPVYDHIAIMKNGVNNHNLAANNLAGPVSALPGNGNIEDCNFHDLRILWDTATFTLSVYLDCSLRLTYTGNIVQTIFNGSPYVFWGFTAATGALTNEHRFCLNYISFTQALQDTAICKGDTLSLNVGTGFTYAWSPAAGLSDSSIANPRAFPDTTTTYYVAVTDPCMNTRIDSVTITVHDSASLIFDLGPADSILCGSSTLPLDLTRSGVNFLWQNGSNAPTFSVRTPGKYWAQLSNTCGVSSDTLNIQYEVVPVVDLGPDTLVCNSPNLLLVATFLSQTVPGTQYLWQDGSTLPTFLASQDDSLHVQVSNFCGVAADTIAVRFLNSPQPVNLGVDTLICTGDSILLNAYQAGMNHSWNTGATDSAIWVKSAGTYTASVSNACGTETDDKVITDLAAPSVYLGNDTTLCEGTTYIITVNVSPMTAITWGDGTTQLGFLVAHPGTVICTLINVCGQAIDSLLVTYDSIPAPDIGPDSLLCAGEILTLDMTVANAAGYRWQGGPSSPQWTVGSPGRYIGEAFNLCGTGRDTMYMTRLPIPSINLGPDVLLCDGDSAVFDYSNQNWTFLWNDGASLSRRAIQDSGTYWLEVSNRCGMDRDEINISEEQTPYLALPVEDTVICAGEVLQLDIFAENIDRYRWSDGSTLSTFTARDEGRFWAQGQNACGIARDTFQLWLDRPATPNLGPDTALCEGQSLMFDVSLIRASYLWQDGSILPAYQTSREGDYWVEVTNSCGTFRDEMTLILDQAPPPVNLGGDQIVCEGDSILLDVRTFSTPTAPVAYRWQDGPADSVRWITQSGLYLVEITNRCGRVFDLMQATFEAPLIPNLGGDTLRCLGERLWLDASLEGVSSYRWQDGRNEARYLTEQEGLFWVTVENSCGPVTDTVRVTDTDCTCSLFVPSAFTPNADQHNDGFCIGFECEVLAYDFQVYNRWGQLVWQTEDPSACWDGNSLSGAGVPEGVYVYVLSYNSRENKRAARRTLNGTITLIR